MSKKDKFVYVAILDVCIADGEPTARAPEDSYVDAAGCHSIGTILDEDDLALSEVSE